jgi:pimeloyl-ACP methyl ester carboxylesterase
MRLSIVIAAAGIGASAVVAGAPVGIGPAPAAAASRTVAGGAEAPAPVGTEAPCPDSEFTCVRISVPRDHFATTTAAQPTWDVTFAIHRATGTRLGAWVTATGGPGSAGTYAADSYMSGMDPAIVEHYDLVFFDQRGTGSSHGITCPAAAAAYYLSPADATDPTQQPLAMAAASTFARDCVAESGVDVADLPYFATTQSVEDLDAFRRYLGVDALDLYGESYGTQLVQQYALAHPANVRSLILDGPVDLTGTISDMFIEAVHSFDRTLSMTMRACSADAACRADVVGGDALRAWADLAARLSAAAMVVPFHLGSGKTAARPFASPHLQTVGLGQVYGQWGRMELQRAVAAASRGNLQPSLRLLYSYDAVDPETLVPTPDPSWSDAAYYAIECTDYAYFDGTDDERARAYLAAGMAGGIGDAYLGRVYTDDLPCAYWPARAQTAARPPAITAHAYPFVVLVADTDPITPYTGALRIVSRAPGARLIVQEGGPHVLYGRGVACVDDLVTGLLVEGALPPPFPTFCRGDLADPYLPLPAGSVRAARDPLAFATAVDDWIQTLPAYEWWVGGTARAGCDHGGRFVFGERHEATTLWMSGCTLTPGLPIAMSGTIGTDGAVLMRIRTSLGDLRYLRDPDGGRRVTGTWRGVRVDRGG